MRFVEDDATASRKKKRNLAAKRTEKASARIVEMVAKAAPEDVHVFDHDQMLAEVSPENAGPVGSRQKMLDLKQNGRSSHMRCRHGSRCSSRYFQKPSSLLKRLTLMPTFCLISIC
jgi:hypothetical protein